MAIKINPWQEKLLVDIEAGGFKSGEMAVMMAGRNVGKSTYEIALRRLMTEFANRPIEELVLSEGRLSGSRFYCVEPVGGNWKEIETWAKETYGEPGEVWPKDQFNWPDGMRWAMNNRKFWFRNERDRTLFVMKWSR